MSHTTIKDSKYLANGVLRRGRQPNPTTITGMLINEGDPPKRSDSMKRNSKGQFVGKKSKSKKKTTKKAKKKTTSKKAKSRKTNPSTPAKKKQTKRKKNPSDLPQTVVKEQQMLTLSDTAKQIAIGTGAYLAPGAIEVVTKGKIHEKLAKLFAGKDKAMEYKHYAQAKVAINTGWFALAWYFTRKGKSKKFRNPVLSGLGAAWASSIADLFLNPKKADDAAAGMRAVLGMPRIRPTTYPYHPDHKLYKKPVNNTTANSSAGTNNQQSTTGSPSTNNSQQDYIPVWVEGGKPYNFDTGAEVKYKWVQGEAREISSNKLLFDQENGTYFEQGSSSTLALGNVTEFWDRGLGNVEEEWVYDDDRALGAGDDVAIINDVDDFYSDDEAAYGGGSYIPNRASF